MSASVSPCTPRQSSRLGPVRRRVRGSPSASLAEQVPALIERDLDLSEPLTVGIGHVRLRFPLEELVFLPRKLVDPTEYLRVVHGASSQKLSVVLEMTRRWEALRPI